MDKEKLKSILQKASEYEKSMPISLAKEFVSIGDKMIEMNDKLDGIINKEEDIEVILEIL